MPRCPRRAGTHRSPRGGLGRPAAGQPWPRRSIDRRVLLYNRGRHARALMAARSRFARIDSANVATFLTPHGAAGAPCGPGSRHPVHGPCAGCSASSRVINGRLCAQLRGERENGSSPVRSSTWSASRGCQGPGRCDRTAGPRLRAWIANDMSSETVASIGPGESHESICAGRDTYGRRVPGDDLVTTAQAARELGISRRTLARYVEQGLVTPELTLPSGHHRWQLRDLRRER